jgi:hypothetical protein
MDFISERNDKSSLCTVIPQLNKAKWSLVPGLAGLFALSAATQTGQICYNTAKDADSKKTLLLNNFHPQPMLHIPVHEVERATFPVTPSSLKIPNSVQRIELRGVATGKYRVVDYVNDKELGTIDSASTGHRLVQE